MSGRSARSAAVANVAADDDSVNPYVVPSDRPAAGNTCRSRSLSAADDGAELTEIVCSDDRSYADRSCSTRRLTIVGTAPQFVKRSRSINRSTRSMSNRPVVITAVSPNASRGTARLCSAAIWNSGVASRNLRALGGRPNSAAKASLLNRWKSTAATMFRCECVAPFGRPVVPLVNRITAGSSSPTSGTGSSAPGCAVDSAGMSTSVESTGTSTAPSSSRRGPSATISFGSESSTP